MRTRPREVPQLSDCPVTRLNCTNAPDSSNERCPGCPVTDGLEHPGVFQLVGEVDPSTGVGVGDEFRIGSPRREGAHRSAAFAIPEWLPAWWTLSPKQIGLPPAPASPVTDVHHECDAGYVNQPPPLRG